MSASATSTVMLLDGLRDLVRDAVRDALRDEIPGLIEAAANRDRRAPDQLMTAEDAATLVGVNADTIRGWVRTGRLKGYHAGRLLRVSREELMQFLQGGQQEERVTEADIERRAAAIAANTRRGR